MDLTKKEQYWIDIASHFSRAGHKVNPITDKDKNPYLDAGIDVEGKFNLGMLVGDNFFNHCAELVGEPESFQFDGFMSKLTLEGVVEIFSHYDNVILTREHSLEIDAIEFFKDGTSVDRVLYIGLDYLVDSDTIISDVEKVTKRLTEARENPERYHDAKYRPGQKMIHAISQDRARPNDIWRRIESICYASIPNLKQREIEFRRFQVKLLEYMGLNIHESSPWSSVIDTVFGDPEELPDVCPFDGFTYELFGGKHQLFINHIIGEEILEKCEYTYFERPTGEDASRTEYDKRTHFRIPGIIYSVAGQGTDDKTKGFYKEVDVSKLSPEDRTAILERTLDAYHNLVFGEAFFHKRNLMYTYDCVLKDMEWVLAVLDSSKLDSSKILEGNLAIEDRKIPVYGEGCDEYGIPNVERHEVRPVRFFQGSDGEPLDFYNLSILDESIPIGTPMKALMKFNDHMGYNFEAAAPFLVEQ